MNETLVANSLSGEPYRVSAEVVSVLCFTWRTKARWTPRCETIFNLLMAGF